jgi:hypothetical protein
MPRIEPYRHARGGQLVARGVMPLGPGVGGVGGVGEGGVVSADVVLGDRVQARLSLLGEEYERGLVKGAVPPRPLSR